MTAAIRQAAYRARRDAKHKRMESALSDILAKLKGRTTPMATELRQIAERGLEVKS